MPEAAVVQQQPAAPPPAVSPPRRRFEIPAFAEATVDDLPQPPGKPAAPAPETPAPAEGDTTAAQDTGAEATPGEPEPKPETPEQAAKREGRRFERKLDRAYRQRGEALARAEAAERELATLKQPKAPEGAPTLEQYEFDPEKYARAMADYAKSEASKEFEQKQRQQTAQQAQQRLIAEWQTKVEKAEEKYDDFHEVVGELQPNLPLTAAIMDAENGPDIAHYLAKNVAETRRIASLGPVAQIREIGKLEATLLAAPGKPQAPSKAPAPIVPLSGAAAVASDLPSEQDDYATWLKKRNRQLGRKV